MEVMFTFPYQQLLYFFFVLPYISNPYFSVNGLEFTCNYILQDLEANTNLGCKIQAIIRRPMVHTFKELLFEVKYMC
ncbi:hypothetical protein AHAS_Ahas04G0209800 [Arachis hypogaea]